MTTALMLLALLLKLAGFVFLFAAALGLLRFKDPLQRMHASTKAGTIGAGLTVAGAALTQADGTTLMIAALTILFLVLTVPVAGHVLGRAIYVSGRAPLDADKDALKTLLAQPPRRLKQMKRNAEG
ncbi:Na(+) H(+) antiporter subunit G [plant metagenome]